MTSEHHKYISNQYNNRSVEIEVGQVEKVQVCIGDKIVLFSMKELKKSYICFVFNRGVVLYVWIFCFLDNIMCCLLFTKNGLILNKYFLKCMSFKEKKDDKTW